jgi:Eukaryotic aspartyl protease
MVAMGALVGAVLVLLAPLNAVAVSLKANGGGLDGVVAAGGGGGNSVGDPDARQVFAFPISALELSIDGFPQFFVATTAFTAGSPAQHFHLLVDSGSDVPWVYSGARCQDATVCDHANRYNSSRSSTYVPNGQSVSASYGGGSWSGFASEDYWNITGLSGTNYRWVYLSRFRFAEATAARWESGFEALDGFVGLTYPDRRFLSTYFTDLIVAGFVEPVVAVDAAAQKVWFGGTGDGAAARSLSWFPLQPTSKNGYYWWQVDVDDILVNGASTGYCGHAARCQAMFDTGAGLLWMGESLRGKGNLQASYDCSQVPSLPSIAFVIGGRKFEMAPEDYILPGKGGRCYTQVNEQADAAPRGRPLRGLQGETLVHLGYPWFKTFFTALDAGHNRVGIADN